MKLCLKNKKKEMKKMSDLNPITRREVFLAAAGGQQVETPEPITREEMYLKKIAEGGGGVLVVHQDTDGVLDKTWQEIHDACFAVLADTDETSKFLSFFYSVGMADDGYWVSAASPSSSSPIEFDMVTFATNSADGYTSTTDGYPSYTE